MNENEKRTEAHSLLLLLLNELISPPTHLQCPTQKYSSAYAAQCHWAVLQVSFDYSNFTVSSFPRQNSLSHVTVGHFRLSNNRYLQEWYTDI